MSSFQAAHKEYLASSKDLSGKDKFQKVVHDMRLKTWTDFLVGVQNNPTLKKKEVCFKLGIKEGTIESIRKEYKLDSPYRYGSKSKSKSKSKIEEMETNNNKKNTKVKKNKNLNVGGSEKDLNDEIEKMKQTF